MGQLHVTANPSPVADAVLDLCFAGVELQTGLFADDRIEIDIRLFGARHHLDTEEAGDGFVDAELTDAERRFLGVKLQLELVLGLILRLRHLVPSGAAIVDKPSAQSNLGIGCRYRAPHAFDPPTAVLGTGWPKGSNSTLQRHARRQSGRTPRNNRAPSLTCSTRLPSSRSTFQRSAPVSKSRA